VTQKRKVAKTMVTEGYPVTNVCELLGLSRSTYYYPPVQVDESELQSAIEDLAGQYPTYGTRRITHQLRRSPYRIHVNRKRVQRVMAEQKLLRPQKQPQKRTTDSQHPYPRYRNLVKDLEISFPDQVWVSDVTYIRLQHDFVYLAIIMDVFTRALRGWCLSRTLDQELTLTALKASLMKNKPSIHHSDQGVQYAAHAYIDLLKVHDIRISMAAVGKAEENGYAERVIRTIKEEEVDLSEYFNFSDATRQIGHFIEVVYMTKRIHSSLGYLTPAEFELAYRLAQTEHALAPP
jgi:transposase InsO family protein